MAIARSAREAPAARDNSGARDSGGAKDSGGGPNTGLANVRSRLMTLRELFAEGLITQSEFDRKRYAIVTAL